MDWRLEDYCDVFISSLDSHSDGTHSLQKICWWASDVMIHFSKSVLMKKQSHLYLEWPEGSFFSSFFYFIFIFLNYAFKHTSLAYQKYWTFSLRKIFFAWLVNQLCHQVSSINRILKKIHLDVDIMSSAYPDVNHSYTGNLFHSKFKWIHPTWRLWNTFVY